MAARLCLTISVLLLSQLAFAQKPDPLTTFCTFEDGKEISIRYNPAIFAKEKLQFGKMWTPGGEPMLLFSPADLALENATLPAGAYSVYIIPDKKKWTLIINKGVGADNKYDQQKDVIRTSMDLGSLGEPATELQLTLAHIGPKVCNLRVYYGKDGAWTDSKEK
jgi:Protein of unknown function (DUF2911)